ncbi:hypothetical protein [Pseudodesulfovibrio sp.]|uniref:hypothetical protein n=1 Tax=unclassified Pseudodesulfovibrio TaxID=2661612 RepID=UPI003AFF779D
MKKMVMLFGVLALVLSASISFAGLVQGSGPNGSETATLVNQAPDNRIFNCEVSTSMGPDSLTTKITGHGGEETYYCDDELADLDQQWTVTVTDESGTTIATATASYTNGQFSPGQIGEGLTFEILAPNVVKLTVTK